MIKSLVTNGGINCQKLQTVNKREIQGTVDDSAVVRAVASHQCGPRSIIWVCCRFSPLLREVFLQVLRFSPHLKNQLFQIPILPVMEDEKTLCNVRPLSRYYHYQTRSKVFQYVWNTGKRVVNDFCCLWHLINEWLEWDIFHSNP